MGFDFSGISISGGGAGANSANKSLSNLDAEGNAKFTDKQDKLVSGTNIKSVNGFSLLGSGNIEISESGSISVDQNYDGTSANAQSGTAVAEGLLTVANKDLSNLSSDGQMVIDTVDGKISNCILDIPQNIKLTLENNVVTLKAGSVVVRGGEVYTTYTLTEDKNLAISSSLENGRYFLYTNSTGTPLVTIQNKFGSGTTLPADSSVYSRFFITTNKTFYNWSGAQNAWVESGVTYPIAMIDVVNGIASFAKDSNGNDMIFNGAGFVGHHAFVYPNVKFLRPNGFNAQGKLKSDKITSNSLLIYEMKSNVNSITLNGTSSGSTRQYYEVDNLDTSLQGFQYVKSENVDYFYNGSQYLKRYETKVVDFSVTGTTVNSFAVEQPVRLATTEMLDKVQDQVDTNTSDIANKQSVISDYVYIPDISTNDYTDNNAELDYLLASDGSSAGLSGITTYCSDYIEITGDYIVLHNVYAPSDATYASYVLYNSSKTLMRAYTSNSTNYTVGDVILKSSIGAKYVRFQTNKTTKPTYSVVNQTTSQKQVNNIIEEYPYTNFSLQNGGFDYKVDSSAENGTINYPNGTNQSSTSSNPRNRSSYIEIPQDGILLTDIFVPTGTTYAAFALYDSNKNAVAVYNRAKLGYQGTGTNIIDKLFIPYGSNYKYVRFQHVDTTSDIIYGIPTNIWYSMPKSEGNNGNLLSYYQNGETSWTPAGLVGDKKSLSIGVFGGSFATNGYAQTAYNKWIEKLGVEYTTYAVGGTGFVQGTNNFVVQATNAGIHDIYVIWCSTNDFTNSQSIGTSSDVYGTNNTIWANFKEVVRILYSKNPNAKVCLFTSSPHLSSSQGNEEGRGDVTTYANTLKQHVEAQKVMCAYYSLPCLDQYNNSQQNGFNYTLVTGGSGFHLTPYGYSLLVNNQIDFLSKL